MLVNPQINYYLQEKKYVPQYAYYVNKKQKPIELFARYRGRPALFIRENTMINTSLASNVLNLDFEFEVAGDFKLPINYFFMDIKSEIGEFRNLEVRETKHSPYEIGGTNYDLYTYKTSLKINLNQAGFVNKTTLNKKINFAFFLRINDDKRIHEQIDYTCGKSLFFEAVQKEFENLNFDYFYKNTFLLNNHKKVDPTNFWETIPLFWLQQKDFHNQIAIANNKRHIFNTKLTLNDKDSWTNRPTKETFESIKYCLEYTNLANQNKKIEWNEDYESINIAYDLHQRPIDFLLTMKAKFLYDFSNDQLIVDNNHGFSGIWLPSKQKAKLKITFINNYLTPQKYEMEQLIEIKNDFNPHNKRKISVRKAIIENYEDFKTIEN
ncbi:hypothetical protein [Ureaplasma urealyticum]|nr:hypothetical protein [Ureaplasma urealyticum]ACI60169.1 conserved hypothetical protein [Ureaplasma urealyticum serovar 10 str. ATCC 33699]EDT49604.1 conserved hypothetical protein [Ureaplasma urealyticum serovar 13 str. ATCC 33698]EDU57072.1 conserved hypothetical protein [Ureaplasma urealyticum serovar 7 str. ATCC 27819]EDU67258.1 conserved hypothetical protein [Ureaplasma urealyticum serovar 11 str. ATCC 33695]EDX53502.1 conserved hypothetical protein [Ureaplasma urealyticum serovar 12 st